MNRGYFFMLRKITIYLIKLLPYIMMLAVLIKLGSLYLVLESPLFLAIDLIFDIIVVIVLILISFVFKFCVYHRLFLYFVIICNIVYFLCYISYEFIPLDVIFVSIIAVITLLLITICYIRYKNERIL